MGTLVKISTRIHGHRSLCVSFVKTTSRPVCNMMLPRRKRVHVPASTSYTPLPASFQRMPRSLASEEWGKRLTTPHACVRCAQITRSPKQAPCPFVGFQKQHGLTVLASSSSTRRPLVELFRGRSRPAWPPSAGLWTVPHPHNTILPPPAWFIHDRVAQNIHREHNERSPNGNRTREGLSRGEEATKGRYSPLWAGAAVVQTATNLAMIGGCASGQDGEGRIESDSYTFTRFGRQDAPKNNPSASASCMFPRHHVSNLADNRDMLSKRLSRPAHAKRSAHDSFTSLRLTPLYTQHMESHFAFALYNGESWEQT